MTRIEQQLVSRRQALSSATCGFGALALAGLSTEASANSRNLLLDKTPHFAPRAKRVIFLFMRGGPSHVDTFDHKPELQAKSRHRVLEGGKLMASPWKFKKHRPRRIDDFSNCSRTWRKQADELCLINSMHCDSFAHPSATIQIHTGSTTFVRPSVGSWVSVRAGFAGIRICPAL